MRKSSASRFLPDSILAARAQHQLRDPPRCIRSRPQGSLRATTIPQVHAGAAMSATYLVPVDFSEAGQLAVEHALQLAGKQQAKLVLLHVVGQIPEIPTGL